MISDEERREVAKRLRNGGIARDSEEAYVLLLWCVGIRPQLPATSTYKYAMVRLANLIDRPTCHDSADFDRESFRCSNCGYRIVSLTPGRADASVLVSPEGLIADWGYCPHCGTEVVPDE